MNRKPRAIRKRPSKPLASEVAEVARDGHLDRYPQEQYGGTPGSDRLRVTRRPGRDTPHRQGNSRKGTPR